MNLENNNFISKNIRELKSENGNKLNKPEEILKEMWVFHTNLYDKQNALKIEETNFRGIAENCPN